MTTETDFTQVNVDADTSANEVQAIPELVTGESTTNLANNASTDFDFNIDYTPIFDMFVYADQALTVRVFVRQDSTDTFRQLGADIPANAAAALGNPLSGLRVPGSMARIRLINLSGVTTTALSAQVHTRSM